MTVPKDLEKILEFSTSLYILPNYGEVIISITPVLFMIVSNSMHKLVNNRSNIVTSLSQAHRLLALVNHSDIGIASIPRKQIDIVAMCICLGNKSNASHGSKLLKCSTNK